MNNSHLNSYFMFMRLFFFLSSSESWKWPRYERDTSLARRSDRQRCGRNHFGRWSGNGPS